MALIIISVFDNNNIRSSWIKTFFLLSCVVLGSYGATDSELLLKFKDKLQSNNNGLSSWNESTTPCNSDHGGNNWAGVICNGGKIWGLQLENMGLNGVFDVESLKDLPFLRTLSFMNNDLNGTMPEINKVVGLKAIYLSNNKFSGEIPDQTFEGMKWLKKIHLSNNQFSGAIPNSLTKLSRLMELKLDGNKFSGYIPPFQQNTLKLFTVANNQLQGDIPATLSKIPESAFSGNEGLCGTPLGACITVVHYPKKPSTISTIVVAVVVGLAVICVIGAILFILLRKRKSSNSSENEPSGLNKKGVKDAGDESHRSSRSNQSRRGENTMKLCFIKDDAERFDLHELLRASAEILGSGCFSSSYKASLVSGGKIVVKRFKQMNNVGKEEFHEHMRRIGRLNHPNLLPLVAYYYRKEEKLLVSNYVQNGSLAVRLHGHQALGEPSLDWPTRLKIVKGIATGLEYLYKDMPSLIAPHGNLKSCNVLLTQSFEPLLCDYGLVPVINQDLAQDIMVIYKSPEYLQHGRITKKTDIWCLGILILEILSGKFPSNFLQQGKGSELSLANWVLSVDPEDWINEVFDKDMGGTRNSDYEMVKLLKVALECCEGDVDKRLDLKEALEKIQDVKEKDHDDDFYSSYASEADMRSSRGLSGEIIF
ncbi:PREDICTED: pollen receptor-like kinase 1 isoform X1 [Lupinus angustifolius]|uniref:pollen receptor-like kinase 1 isoform X1 n=1 Tax=Lupinus angustifolius TaxID=3871 RepID=UPI00092F4FDA|nr:PREDICTED: pollen receptor-like kinase 1 isoform X1 [Lupinus angustifolius]